MQNKSEDAQQHAVLIPGGQSDRNWQRKKKV
jgi:hypothetical protein